MSSHVCLIKGLKSGRLRAVGLDVLPEEPPELDYKDEFICSWLDQDSAFNDRIIINPHSAYFSPQSYVEMREKASYMALRALSDTQIQNQII